MKRFSRKTIAILAVSATAVIAALGAYAYWTASGSGQGTAAVGTDAGVIIENVAFTGSLYPGESVQVDFDVRNLSADAKAKVDKVVQDGPVTGLPTGCSAADFSFADVSINKEFLESESAHYTGTLSMANTAVNQDACKTGAPVLHLETDNSGI